MECSTINQRKWTEPASTRTGGSTIQRQTSRTPLNRLTELSISMRACPSLMQSTLTLATFQHREGTRCPATQARWWQRLRTGTPLAASSLGRLGYRTGKLVASRLRAECSMGGRTTALWNKSSQSMRRQSTSNSQATSSHLHGREDLIRENRWTILFSKGSSSPSSMRTSPLFLLLSRSHKVRGKCQRMRNRSSSQHQGRVRLFRRRRWTSQSNAKGHHSTSFRTSIWIPNLNQRKDPETLKTTFRVPITYNNNRFTLSKRCNTIT